MKRRAHSRGLVGLLALVACAALAPGCQEPQREPDPSPSTSPFSSSLALHVLPHHKRWSKRLGQGGAPLGEAGYAALARLGYRVVLSVDGQPPPADLARRHGLEVLHVPFGYDEVERPSALQVVRAVRDASGPVYVHCHHGKHRGPTAAALARVALEGVTPVAAEADLRASGCSPLYEGLYEALRTFERPSADEIDGAAVAPHAVQPSGLRAAMLQIDGYATNLEEARGAEWQGVPDHPDIAPAHEALLLREAFRESARLRLDDATEGSALRRDLRKAEGLARTLEARLRAGDAPGADAAQSALAQSCADCHSTHRAR